MFRKNRGFTLVENLVAIAIFVLLAGVIYQTSALLIRSVGAYREDTTISSLASQYMEIVHNLPYSSIGVKDGNPTGTLPSSDSPTLMTVNGSAYKIFYAVSYVDDPADGLASNNSDPAPTDYKQVKLYIQNIGTGKSYSFLTNITPKGLENMASGGALVIQVIDAVGQPVPNATVHITNTNISPNINLTRTTDTTGKWIEVGLATSSNSYHIVVTKNGYSSNQTYPISVSNPNPTKPDSTIVDGQITQVSFAIDKLSTLAFETLDQACHSLSGIGLEITGAKLIGNPNLLKFDRNYTSNTDGQIDLGSIEWDNYTPTLTDSTYMVYGSSPIQQVSVLPNTNQDFTLLLGPKTANSLLVTVKDSATGNPVEGATVELQSGTPNFDQSKVTGGSVWTNFSWTTGTGQDSNVSTDLLPYGLRLLSYDNGQTYVSSGYLTSTVFDTNTASTTYSTLTWQPTSQDPATTIQFQIATSNDNTATTTWNFTGPDGTNGSYYTTPGTTINSPSARYIRYKAFLSTTDNTKTPVLSNINVNYVSGCFTPGQVFFAGLTAGNNYNITVNASNYTAQTINNLNVSGNQTLNISL